MPARSRDHAGGVRGTVLVVALGLAVLAVGWLMSSLFATVLG